MTQLALQHYLAVGAIMFAIGLIGFMTRRNLIVMFLCTELMFQAAGIALIAFSRFHLNHHGETFSTPFTPANDNPKSLPVKGTHDPRQKAYPQT